MAHQDKQRMFGTGVCVCSSVSWSGEIKAASPVVITVHSCVLIHDFLRTPQTPRPPPLCSALFVFQTVPSLGFCRTCETLNQRSNHRGSALDKTQSVHYQCPILGHFTPHASTWASSHSLCGDIHLFSPQIYIMCIYDIITVQCLLM